MDLPELRVYEVDKQDNFDVKEPLVANEPLSVASRHAIAAEFEDKGGQWARDLVAAGFDPTQPTVCSLKASSCTLRFVTRPS